MSGFLGAIILGGIAGYIASLLYKGTGNGIIINIILGIIGSVVGCWVFGLLGFSTSGLIGQLITAVVGAVLVLFIYNMVKK